MAGRRHHTIPRFILKGFASSVRGGEVNVWLYRKGAIGIEVNIRNVSVERDFYGRATESDLDKRITLLEEDLSRLVDKLRNAPEFDIGPIRDDSISRLVAHLAIRTRQVRDGGASAMNAVLNATEDFFGTEQNVASLVRREITKEGYLRDSLRKALDGKGVPPEKLDIVIRELEPHLGTLADAVVVEACGDAARIAKEQVEAYKEMMPEAFRLGFVDSMSKDMVAEERRKRYDRLNWFRLRLRSPLILGDSVCVFETKGKRRFKPLDGSDDELHRIYVPLDSRTLLVGSDTSSPPLIDLRAINRAIARCSGEFFISSVEISRGDPLSKRLGEWAGILNGAETQDLVFGALSDAFDE